MRFKKTKIYYALALITSTTMLASPVGLASENLNLHPNTVDQFKASVPLSNLMGDVLTSGNSLSAPAQRLTYIPVSKNP